jgi:hypothetical protein
MPESPETHKRITKIQKDVEELKQDREDTWHLDRERYEELVKRTLNGDDKTIALYLEIDGIRCLTEIDEALGGKGISISRMTLWRAEQKLLSGGLIRKIGKKNKSPIYEKKRGAYVLNMDDYVRKLLSK